MKKKKKHHTSFYFTKMKFLNINYTNLKKGGAHTSDHVEIVCFFSLPPRQSRNNVLLMLGLSHTLLSIGIDCPSLLREDSGVFTRNKLIDWKKNSYS